MLRLLDATAIIKRTTNLIQGNADTCVAFWMRSAYNPTSPDYITALVKQDLDIAAYTQWTGIYSNPGLSDGSYLISVNNGVVSQGTASALIGTNMAYLGYRKSGNTHSFYRNASFVGSTTVDMSAVTFLAMLLGNDRTSGVNGNIDFFDFIEYTSSKSVFTLANQMQVIGSVVDSTNLHCFCPLASDLLDISGNANHFSGSGNFTFVANPTFPSNMTPATALTLPLNTTFSQNINVNGFNPVVWYKHVNNTSKPQVLSYGAWGDFTGYNPNSDGYITEDLDNSNVQDGFINGSCSFPIPAGYTFWMDFKDTNQNAAAGVLNIKSVLGPDNPAQSLDIFIRCASFGGGPDLDEQDGASGGPYLGLHAGLIRPTTSSIVGYSPLFPCGESGDVMRNAKRYVFVDEGISYEPAPSPVSGEFAYWVYLMSIDNDMSYSIIVKQALPSPQLPPSVNRTHLPTEKVYMVSNHAVGVKKFWIMDTSGNLTGPTTLTGISSATAVAVNNDESYMFVGSSGILKRWNLNTNSFDSDLAAAVTNYSITDILVLADDTIVVCYFKSTVTRDVFVRRYNSSGVILNTYTFTFTGTITNVDPRLGYSSQSNAFWILNHLTSGDSDVRLLNIDGTPMLATSITSDVNRSDDAVADPPIPYTSDSCPIIEFAPSSSGPPIGADLSGMYEVIPGKTQDTIWVDVSLGTEADVNIP